MFIDERLSAEGASNMQLTAEEALLYGQEALRAAFIGEFACTRQADDLLTRAFWLRTLSSSLSH